MRRHHGRGKLSDPRRQDGRAVGTLPPVLIVDGRRDNGAIANGVYAEAQRPGKGLLTTPAGTEGVLVGWSPPPAMTARRQPPP